MKSYRKFIIGAFLGLSLTGAGLFLGCSAQDVQNTADDVSYVAGGPTTQPSSGNAVLDTARTGGQIATAAVPALRPIFGLVVAAAGVVSTIAGHFNGKRVQAKQSNSIISEIVGDVAAFKNPAQPWTASAEKLLTDLGYVEAAVTQPIPPQA